MKGIMKTKFKNVSFVKDKRTKEQIMPWDLCSIEQIVIGVAYFAEFQSKYKYLLIIINSLIKLISIVALIKQDENSIKEAIKIIGLINCENLHRYF